MSDPRAVARLIRLEQEAEQSKQEDYDDNVGDETPESELWNLFDVNANVFDFEANRLIFIVCFRFSGQKKLIFETRGVSISNGHVV